MGVLRGKTKPFPTLIISTVMRQRRSSWVHDVTQQDCGLVASNTLFWSEIGPQLILECAEGIVSNGGLSKGQEVMRENECLKRGTVTGDMKLGL